MFSAAFIFEPGQYDEEFHRLDGLIAKAADKTPGYLGREVWKSVDGRQTNATYYWESLEALQQFSRDANHLEAKKQYQRWYAGYQIVIAEIVRSYGDGKLAHLTPNERSPQ